MIDRKRVNPSFHIGEILQKERSHIRVDLIALRTGKSGTGAMPRSTSGGAASESWRQSKTVPNKPSDARQLASTIAKHV